MQPTVTTTDIDGNNHSIPTSQLKWRPSAYAIVVDNNKILLSKQFGKYILPGGAVELGETPEQAVVREVQEETGYLVDNPRLVGTGNSFFTFQETATQTDHFQAILLFYVCQLKGGAASIDDMEEAKLGFGEMPQWVPVARLNAITPGGTFDWLTITRKAVG